MGLSYFQGDELAPWVGTVTVNGTLPDLSTGWTFTVTLAQWGQTTITKTTGITGAAAGVFTVAWATGDLDIAPGNWKAQLTARSVDGKEFTVEESVKIRTRVLAET